MEPTITTTHNNIPTPTPTPALLNGKKQHHQVKHAHPHPLYRECLKNHAAALGGHAVDGCGEFMSFPISATCAPSPLMCAACGCHRNFHRRLYHPNLLEVENHHQMHSSSFPSSSSEDDEGEEGQSGPHMLLALSAGGNGGSPSVVGGPLAMATTRRKRFRSRFSPEQKEKMYELSERLGWRMQRRDEGIIEERCREIGVHRGVFKVWMHNNKHNYISSGSPAPRRDTINANNGLADASSA